MTEVTVTCKGSKNTRIRQQHENQRTYYPVPPPSETYYGTVKDCIPPAKFVNDEDDACRLEFSKGVVRIHPVEDLRDSGGADPKFCLIDS